VTNEEYEKLRAIAIESIEHLERIGIKQLSDLEEEARRRRDWHVEIHGDYRAHNVMRMAEALRMNLANIEAARTGKMFPHQYQVERVDGILYTIR